MATSILTFVPAYNRQLTVDTFLTTHALNLALSSKGIGGSISSLSYPDIAELRNIALTIWYDTLPNFTHMLMLDADMAFDPQLVLDMLMFNEPLVSAICPKRTLPIQWAGSGTGEKVAEQRGGFMKVEGCGMAITLIRRDVVATMLEKFPNLVDERLEHHIAKDIFDAAGVKRVIRAFDRIDDPVKGPLSEDLSFCRRWGECGGAVWAAIGYRITHVGPYPYGHDVSYLEYAMKQQQELAPKLQAAE